jgi:hypothetical protein
MNKQTKILKETAKIIGKDLKEKIKTAFIYRRCEYLHKYQRTYKK